MTTREHISLADFTETKLLTPCLLSDRQDNAIWELTQRLSTLDRIHNAPAFAEAVRRREAELPTFVGDGVVVPHARGGAVRRLSMAVGLSTTGIPWGKNSGQTAHVVFLFAVPLTGTQTYLRLLAGVADLLRNELGLAGLRRATQPEEMLGILRAVCLVGLSSQPEQPGLPLSS